MVKYKTNVLQKLNLQLILHLKPLVRSIVQVKVLCPEVSTAFHSVMTAFHSIMTAFHSIMTAFHSVMTLSIQL